MSTSSGSKRNPKRILSPSEINEKTKSTLNEVMGAVVDEQPQNHIVGIHGRDEDVRATLVEIVCRRVDRDALFKKTIRLDLQPKDTREQVQRKIAEELGISEPGKSPEERAQKLRQKMTEIKGVLIILEDVCQILDSKEIGIPCDKDCKILFTSADYSKTVKKEGNTPRAFCL